MSAEPIRVVEYDDDWPVIFAELGSGLRRALGATAIRIDHIGSTAVPGLAAKPIIDVQISVSDFEPLDAVRIPLAGAGLEYRENTDLTKRYFRERPGDLADVGGGRFVGAGHRLAAGTLRPIGRYGPDNRPARRRPAG